MIDGACPVCGTPVDPDQRECGRCGFKLIGSTEQFAPVTVSSESDAPVVSAPAAGVEGMAFVVTKGPQVGAVFYIDRPSLSIGRDPSCDVFLNDMTVSRRHAVVSWDGSTVSIEDLGSLNGTWVDGVLVPTAVLEPGTVVQIGIFSMVLVRESEA